MRHMLALGGDFFMEKERTTIKAIWVEEKKLIPAPEKENTNRIIDCSGEKGASSLFQPDRLIKNIALSCGLMLVILALRTANLPESQSVFSALETGVNTKWDESIGKLSFVTSLFPEEIQEVWADYGSVTVFQPVEGEIVHTWTEQEPYIEMLAVGSEVRAAAGGEIMSIAHGMEEERIVRIRHADGTEALYGNLLECFCEIGDTVNAGDPFATLMDGKPLAFEYRRNGRSVELSNGFLSFGDAP